MQKRRKAHSVSFTGEAKAVQKGEVVGGGGDQLDPVKMYLKRIGTVTLLDRAGEVAIAKKIEDGRIALYETLFSSKAGVSALLSTRAEVREGNLRSKGFLTPEEVESVPEIEAANALPPAPDAVGR